MSTFSFNPVLLYEKRETTIITHTIGWVEKKTDSTVGRWEVSVYEILQASAGYPKVFHSVVDLGRDQVILNLQFIFSCVGLQLLESNPRIYMFCVDNERYHRRAAEVIADLLELLRGMHRSGVLHGDIHLSNIGLLPRQPLQSIPVFFDFERAIYNGRGPFGDPEPPEHACSPSRILSGTQSTYTARDDVESFAYTMLHLIRGSHCPWIHADGDDTDLVRRQWALENWAEAKGRSLHAVDKVALEFVKYAQGLAVDKEIAYQDWIDRFRAAIAPTCPAPNVDPPVFYTFEPSIWTAVNELAIGELGLTNEVEKKQISLFQAENFSPEFLKNTKVTLPMLVVEGKAYTSTIDVTDYLVKVAHIKVAPRTALSAKVHEDKYNPNLAFVGARNEDELKAKSTALPRVSMEMRLNGLKAFAAAPYTPAELKPFYDAEIAATASLLTLYTGEASEQTKQVHFATIQELWKNIHDFLFNVLPAAITSGPFVAGAMPGEDDFHVGVWTAHVGALFGAAKSDDVLAAIEKGFGELVPPEVVAYLKAWQMRPSWRAMYAEVLR